MQVETLLERIGIGPTHVWMIATLSVVEIINGYKIVMSTLLFYIVSLISPILSNNGLSRKKLNIYHWLSTVGLSLALF